MHLDLLGQRNDVVLVQLNDSVHIDLERSILVRSSIRRDILRIDGRLLTQPLQQLPFHFRFRNQSLEGRTVRVLDVRDEGRGIRDELGL